MFTTSLRKFFKPTRRNPTPLVWLLNPQLFNLPEKRTLQSSSAPSSPKTTTISHQLGKTSGKKQDTVSSSRPVFPGLYFTDNMCLPQVSVPLEELPRNSSAVWA
ncbi:MAG: hypothetical protein M1835_005400 [Candelina submexicana]|nr:MAG: hypothetical protein M1835_005400 [Candelina submexicana]